MKSALLFPGYGSQFVGMGKELYDEFRIVQEYFEEASNCLDVNFVKLCFASSDAELSKMVNAYTSLFLLGGAIFALLKDQGIEPEILGGYNNGEHTALFAGGCFSFPDGLYLLNKFCLFYQEMLDQKSFEAVHFSGVPTLEVKKICDTLNKKEENIFVAIYNGIDNCIVTGTSDYIKQLDDALKEKFFATMNYSSVNVGLHSIFMHSVIDQFKIYLEKVDFKDMRIPLISGLDGKKIHEGSQIKERFIRHNLEPFYFNLVLRELINYDIIIIASAQDDLSAMVKKQYPEKYIVSIAKKADIDALKKMMISI